MSSPARMSTCFALTAEQFVSLTPREARRRFLISRFVIAFKELSSSRLDPFIDFTVERRAGARAEGEFEDALARCIEGECGLDVVLKSYKTLVYAYTDLRDRSSGAPQLPDITEYAT